MGIRRSKFPSLCWAAFVLFLIGCAGEEEKKENARPGYTVSGSLTRSVALDPGLWMCKLAPVIGLVSGFGPDRCDARGDVYLQLMTECPALSGCLPDVVAEVTIPDADLSAEDASVPFAFSNVPDGTYFLYGFLDDAPNILNPASIAETGDLVMFGLSAPRCEKVNVSGGDVTGLRAELDSVMPFALPMTDGSCQKPDDEDPEIVDDGNLYTVTATVIRSVKITLLDRILFGTDGIGPLHIALVDECFTSEGSIGSLVTERHFDEVDLSKEDAAFSFSFDPVPNGVYYINGFIDDVTDATEERPLPAVGDLVSFHDLGPGCTKVIVNGSDVTADPYPLNMIMVFDLNDI